MVFNLSSVLEFKLKKKSNKIIVYFRSILSRLAATASNASTAGSQMIQFPQGFQGTSLAGFTPAAGNFANFRPTFSVPGQQMPQVNST